VFSFIGAAFGFIYYYCLLFFLFLMFVVLGGKFRLTLYYLQYIYHNRVGPA